MASAAARAVVLTDPMPWAQGAEYAWDFLADRARFNRSYVGALASTPNWTFTRASTGYAANAAGVLIPFASGELRRTDRGVLIEGARTNLALWSNDWTNAAWTKTNITATLDQAGPDGVSNSATRLTATAGNGTALQTITSASATRYGSVYIKRVTGSGNIQMTLDGGTGWTTISVTSAWQQLGITQAAVTDPNFGLRLVTNGDEVAVFCGMVESASFPSSPIVTTTASATRAADSLTVTGVTGLAYPLTLYAEFERAVDTGGSEILFQVDDGSVNNRGALFVSSGDLGDMFSVSGGVQQSQSTAVTGAVAVGTVYRLAARFAADDLRACRSGSLGPQDTAATNPAAPTTVRFAQSVSGATPSFGYLRRAAIFASAKADAQLQSLTAA